MNGNNIFISVPDGNSQAIIAGTKANKIQSGAELIEISSPTSGSWKQFIAGRKEWSFTVNYLVLTSASALRISGGNGVKDLLQVGNQFAISIVTRQGTSTTIQAAGNAILKICEVSASRGDIATGTFQFVGNGPLAVPSA